MSDEEQTAGEGESDTPPDHTVIALELHADTLPEWWERILALAPDWCRRMSVAEFPEAWYVRMEIHKDRVEDFHVALAEAWRVYQADIASRNEILEEEE